MFFLLLFLSNKFHYLTIYCNQYFRSFSIYSVFSLYNPVPILTSSFYVPGQKTVFFVFGYGGEAGGKSVQTIVEACLGIANICLVNWEKEASLGILGPLSYPIKALPNTIRVCAFECYLIVFEYAYLHYFTKQY